MIAKHDPNKFETGATQYLTLDEESSGIFDAQSILGAGMFMIVDQAHYAYSATSPAVVEGGQILTMYNPETDVNNPEVSVLGNNVLISLNDTLPSATDFTDFGAVSTTSNLSKSFVIKNTGKGNLTISDLGISGVNASEFSFVGGLPALPISIALIVITIWPLALPLSQQVQKRHLLLWLRLILTKLFTCSRWVVWVLPQVKWVLVHLKRLI